MLITVLTHILFVLLDVATTVTFLPLSGTGQILALNEQNFLNCFGNEI